MAKKRTGRLAGLAALAGAAYMINEKLNKGKDATAPAATAAEKDASDARTKAQREAVSGPKPVEKSGSAYNPVASSDTQGQAARNRGVGDATNGMDLPKPAPKPALNKNSNAPINPSNPAAKKDIVTKEQLAEFRRRFGKDKTLTDYMNARNALRNQDAGKQLKPIVLPDRYRMGGKVKEMASGGITASRRGDGIAQRGRTRGKIR